MKKIILLVLSATLLCCCTKQTNITLDKHSVEIFPGETVVITANTECFWTDKDYYIVDSKHTKQSDKYVFTASGATTLSDRSYTIYAGYAAARNSTSSSFVIVDKCIITVKATYKNKGQVQVNYLDGYWQKAEMTLYSYHDLNGEYYLTPDSRQENPTFYKVYENPFYLMLPDNTPEYTCRYKCDMTNQRRTYFLNF